MASKTGGTASVDADGSAVYEDSAGCSSFFVSVAAASAVGATVEVDEMHAAGEGVPLAVGQGLVFRQGFAGIKKVTIKGIAGTATVNFGVVAKYPTTASARTP